MGPKPACLGAFSNTFWFSKSVLPSTHGHANAKNIPILENLGRPDQNVHFGESELNIRKIENTVKTQKCTYFGENIYFLQEKKICASFPKNIRLREKIGDLTMKANFI